MGPCVSGEEFPPACDPIKQVIPGKPGSNSDDPGEERAEAPFARGPFAPRLETPDSQPNRIRLMRTRVESFSPLPEFR